MKKLKKQKLEKNTIKSPFIQGMGLSEKRMYERNIKELKKRDSYLAEAVENTVLGVSFLLERTGKNEIPNLLIKRLNRYYYESYDVNHDVEQQVTALQLKNSRIALFLGIGLGYEVNYFLQNYATQQKTEHILVVEESFEIFKYAMCVTDLTKLFSNPHAEFMIGVKQEAFFAQFVNFFKESNRMFFIKAIKAVYHMSSMLLSKDYYFDAIKSFREAGVYQVTFYGNDPEDSMIGIENMLKNVKEIVGNPGINLLYNKFKGKPAIVVSTGPSLNKNKHLLKGLEDKAVIICPDASLRILLDMGIKPHLVTSLERVPATVKLIEGFNSDEVEDVYYAASPVVMKEAYEAYPGPRVIVYRDFDHFRWLGIERGILDIKHSSGNMAFKLGEAMGCDPIILIGQDLAYSRDGTSHASGTLYGENQVPLSNAIEVMGNDGKKIYTNETWNLFRQAFEVDIAKFRGTCINSTEGGAYIHGTKIMPFQEAIEKYIQQPFQPLEKIKNTLSVFTAEEAEQDSRKVKEVIDNSVPDLLAIIKDCYNGIEKCADYKVELEEYLSGDIDISKSRLLHIYQEIFSPKNNIITSYKSTFQLLMLHVIQSFHINFEINMNELPERYAKEEFALAEQLLHQVKWFEVIKNFAEMLAKLIIEAKVELFFKHSLTEEQANWLSSYLKTQTVESNSTAEEVAGIATSEQDGEGVVGQNKVITIEEGIDHPMNKNMTISNEIKEEQTESTTKQTNSKFLNEHVLKDKVVLVTGGTGSFGNKFIETALKSKVKKIIVFSRDELKQYEMAQRYNDSRIRYFIGDVRDKERLIRAFDGVDIVIHAAAMKHVGACEYNPFEAVKTNIHGAQNIIDAAIDRGVKKVIALSTDKACSPVNLYGATKLASDKLFVAANSYVGDKETKFSVVRYGNVVGSRGSVVPFFKQLAHTGKLPITDERMTRFWITLEQGVQFVINSLDRMSGGEIFVPKIPSMKVTDLAAAIAPDAEIEIVGIRPGEKLHEAMITEDDARHTIEFDSYYVIQPEFSWWSTDYAKNGNKIVEGFSYTSDSNDKWLTMEQIRELIEEM